MYTAAWHTACVKLHKFPVFSTFNVYYTPVSSRGGVVLTFYTNQQSYDSFDSLRVSANTATNDAVIFTEDLLNVRNL